MCARSLALQVRRPPCPDGAPGEGEEGPSLPGTFLGGRGGARRAPGKTPEVSPLSPGAAAAASLRLCHFCVTAVLRAPLVSSPTSEPRYLLEELFWGGSAHGAAGREGAPPPGKALCGPSESRVIKLRLLRAASSVPGSRAFEVGVRIFLLNEMIPRLTHPGAWSCLAVLPEFLGLMELIVLLASPVHSLSPGSNYPSVVFAG